MPDMPDLSLKSSLDPNSILAAYQRKYQQQQEMQNAANAQQNQQFNQWQEIAKQTSTAVGQMVEGAKLKQKKDFIRTFADSMANQPSPNANPALVNMGGVNQQVPTASYNPTNADATRAAIQLNPEAASADYLKRLSVDPNAALVSAQTKAATLQGKLLENQLKAGQTGDVPDSVKKMLTTAGIQVPDGMSKQDLKLALPGMSAGLRAGVLGEMARARGDQVTATLADKMATDINPSKWTPGSPGGVAAQRVLAAKDAKSLFEQIRTQPDGPVRQQAVEGAIATMKTLMGSGNGQVSEKLVNEMIPHTAGGKVADLETFFKNDPTGTAQQKFMDLFEKQVDRVNVVNSQIIDDRVRQAISTHKVLHKRDPEAWEANMEAAGLDPKDVVNDVYKPQNIRRLQNTALGQANVQPSGGGLQIDQNALSAELKRRGL